MYATYAKERKRKKKKVAPPTENQNIVEDMMTFICNEECIETGEQKRLFKCKKCTKIAIGTLGGGWTNYIAHLKSCYGNETSLLTAYGQRQQLTSKKKMTADRSLLNYLGRRILTREEEGVYHLVKLAVVKNVNFNILNSKEFRDAFKYGGLDDKLIGKNMLEDVIHALVIIVEKKISALLKDAKFLAILHDA